MRTLWAVSLLLILLYLGAGSHAHTASRIPKPVSTNFGSGDVRTSHAVLMNLRLLEEAKACSVRERLKKGSPEEPEEDEEEEYEDSCMQQFIAAAEIYARRKAEEAEQALQRLRGGGKKGKVISIPRLILLELA
jgi:hypothetical protein